MPRHQTSLWLRCALNLRIDILFLLSFYHSSQRMGHQALTFAPSSCHVTTFRVIWAMLSACWWTIDYVGHKGSMSQLHAKSNTLSWSNWCDVIYLFLTWVEQMRTDYQNEVTTERRRRRRKKERKRKEQQKDHPHINPRLLQLNTSKLMCMLAAIQASFKRIRHLTEKRQQ